MILSAFDTNFKLLVWLVLYIAKISTRLLFVFYYFCESYFLFILMLSTNYLSYHLKAGRGGEGSWVRVLARTDYLVTLSV